jgi:hypothetical protein
MNCDCIAVKHLCPLVNLFVKGSLGGFVGGGLGGIVIYLRPIQDRFQLTEAAALIQKFRSKKRSPMPNRFFMNNDNLN